MTPEHDAAAEADAPGVEVAAGLLDHSWPDDILGDPPDQAQADDDLPVADDPADDWLEPRAGHDREHASWSGAGDVAAPPVPDAAELGALFAGTAGPQRRAPVGAARLVRLLGRHRSACIGAAVLVGAVLLGLGAQLAGRSAGPAESPHAATPSRPADDRPQREPDPKAGAHRGSAQRAGSGRARPPRRARPSRPSRRAREGAPTPPPHPPAPPVPRHEGGGAETSQFTSEFTP